MTFLAALFAVVGFVSGTISIYNLTNSLPHTTKRKNSIFGLVLAVIFLAAFIISRTAPTSGNSNTGTSTQINSPRSTPTQTASIISTIEITPALTATPTPTDTPTPSSTPTVQQISPGSIIYTADFTNKAGDWSLGNNEFISSGNLFATGGKALLTYPMPTSNYTIQATIIVKNDSNDGSCAEFGIIARYQSPNTGDEAALSSCTDQFAAVSTCPGDSCGGQSARIGIPINQVIPVQITCKGTQITVTLLGNILSTEDAQNAPVPGNVAIEVNDMTIVVLSLKVIAA